MAVLDGGRIVEHGPAATVLAAPDHAVTRALVAAGHDVSALRPPAEPAAPAR
jgi:ABC-type microcin C transport system duplicated ATPase subunit YejF